MCGRTRPLPLAADDLKYIEESGLTTRGASVSGSLTLPRDVEPAWVDGWRVTLESGERLFAAAPNENDECEIERVLPGPYVLNVYHG